VLFNKFSILDVLPDQLRQIKQKVQELKADYLLNASEEDLVAQHHQCCWWVGNRCVRKPDPNDPDRREAPCNVGEPAGEYQKPVHTFGIRI
jgi:hypothetical protein